MPKRFDYVKYDEQSIANQSVFKKKVEDLTFAIEMLDSGRAQSLALTKLEECYMWIGKALRDSQSKRNTSTELQEERSNS